MEIRDSTADLTISRNLEMRGHGTAFARNAYARIPLHFPL
jgi:hypothetical protein